MIKKLLNTKISKENKKGFTLAELLIVVAIIGVLVAISIPIFTAQLEKSRDSTTSSNIRSAYAIVAAWLTKDSDSANHVTVSVGSNQANGTVKVGNVLAKGTQSGFASKEKELPGALSNGNITT